jgi:hypothetical protein
MIPDERSTQTDYLPRCSAAVPPTQRHKGSFLDHCLGSTSRPVDIEGWELILRARPSAEGYQPEVVPAPFYEQDGQKLEQLIGQPLQSLYDITARYAYAADCLRELELQMRASLHRLRGTKRLFHRPA